MVATPRGPVAKLTVVRRSEVALVHKLWRVTALRNEVGEIVVLFEDRRGIFAAAGGSYGNPRGIFGEHLAREARVAVCGPILTGSVPETLQCGRMPHLRRSGILPLYPCHRCHPW